MKNGKDRMFDGLAGSGRDEKDAIRRMATIANLQVELILIDESPQLFDAKARAEMHKVIDELIDEALDPNSMDPDLKRQIAEDRFCHPEHYDGKEDDESYKGVEYIPWMDKYWFESTAWDDYDWKEYFDELRAKTKGGGDED